MPCIQLSMMWSKVPTFLQRLTLKHENKMSAMDIAKVSNGHLMSATKMLKLNIWDNQNGNLVEL